MCASHSHWEYESSGSCGACCQTESRKGDRSVLSESNESPIESDSIGCCRSFSQRLNFASQSGDKPKLSRKKIGFDEQIEKIGKAARGTQNGSARSGCPSYDRLALIVMRAQTGDKAALNELIRRFYPVVLRRVQRSLKNESCAQDLCQEIFIRIIRRLYQLKEPTLFAAWVKKIVRRMTATAFSRNVWGIKHGERLSYFFQPDGMATTPLQQLLAKECQSQIRHGLQKLAEDDREALVAFYFHGLTLSELSSRLDRPVGTLKRRLHVARRRLAFQLSQLANT